MTQITYLEGDATEASAGKGWAPRVIAHVCNDEGIWGAGFVLALSQKWWQPKAMYRSWYMDYNNHPVPFKLGEIQPVHVEGNIFVVNMIAQDMGPQPRIKYDALSSCLAKLESFMVGLNEKAELHIPRIGCGLAGGSWPDVESYLLSLINGPIYVYDLPEKK